jgi:hypothetical protein
MDQQPHQMAWQRSVHYEERDEKPAKARSCARRSGHSLAPSRRSSRQNWESIDASRRQISDHGHTGTNFGEHQMMHIDEVMKELWKAKDLNAKRQGGLEQYIARVMKAQSLSAPNPLPVAPGKSKRVVARGRKVVAA